MLTLNHTLVNQNVYNTQQRYVTPPLRQQQKTVQQNINSSQGHHLELMKQLTTHTMQFEQNMSATI